MPVNHQANKEVIIPAMVDSYLHKGFGLLLYNGNIEEYDKESACQCRRHGFYPWVMKIPWRRKWQRTPVFLPENSHGQRTLVGYSLWDHKELDPAELATHCGADYNFDVNASIF